MKKLRFTYIASFVLSAMLLTACGSKKEDIIETNTDIVVETEADATEETTTEAVIEETTTEEVSEVEETTEEVTTEVSKADPKKEETKPAEKPKKDETKPVAETPKKEESKPVKETPKKEETTTEKPAETKPSNHTHNFVFASYSRSGDNMIENYECSCGEYEHRDHKCSFTLTKSTTGNCGTPGKDTFTCACGNFKVSDNNKYSGEHTWVHRDGSPIYDDEPHVVTDDGKDWGPQSKVNRDELNKYIMERTIGFVYNMVQIGYSRSYDICTTCRIDRDCTRGTCKYNLK